MNGSFPEDPWDLVSFVGFEDDFEDAYKLFTPVLVVPIETDDAEVAYELVLADAGATFPPFCKATTNVFIFTPSVRQQFSAQYRPAIKTWQPQILAETPTVLMRM